MHEIRLFQFVKSETELRYRKVIKIKTSSKQTDNVMHGKKEKQQRKNKSTKYGTK